VTIIPRPDSTRDASPDGQTYTIGTLAAEFGVTPRTIRFYEDEGLIAPRRVGTSRIYSHQDRGRLALICRGKRLGFSLAEIKEFLDLYDTDPDQLGQMSFALERARGRIAQLEIQLADVQRTLGELREIEAAMADHLRRYGAIQKSN
jgi:DNA-binding transcriptional MerR regulator